MINPDKLYKLKNHQARVTNIEDETTPLAEFTVQTECGTSRKGFIKDINNFRKRFSVGDRVTVKCKFSIMSYKWRVTTLRHKRSAKPLEK